MHSKVYLHERLERRLPPTDAVPTCQPMSLRPKAACHSRSDERGPASRAPTSAHEPGPASPETEGSAHHCVATTAFRADSYRILHTQVPNSAAGTWQSHQQEPRERDRWHDLRTDLLVAVALLVRR